jgi:adenosylhomocysteine nucleosidase
MNLAWVLRRFLAQQAQANLRDQVHEAMRQGLGSTDAGQAAAAASARCDVGIVFALSAESGGTEDLLIGTLTTKGQGFIAKAGVLANRHVVVLQAGAGRLSAARGTQALIAGHRPAWIISAGFAGGLQPDLRRGDIVMADEILDISGRRLTIDLKANSDPRGGIHVGRLLTVDKIVREPTEKAALGRQHQALAVDMESWAVGEVCRQDKVRFLAVRVISDAANDLLPEDLDRLVMQQTTAGRLGAAAGTLLRRPGSIKDMLRLKEEALVASDRLAKILVGVVERLVPGHHE